MSRWIGLFIKAEPDDGHQADTQHLLPALAAIRAATEARIAVKVITPLAGTVGHAERVEQWFSARGVNGVTVTDTIDNDCVLIIGSEVFRTDPDNERFCQPCQAAFVERLAGLGITAWPPRGGGFIEFT